MILSVSIGNTNIRCAVGTKEKNQQVFTPTKTIFRAEDFIYFLEAEFSSDVWNIIEGSIISSVVPNTTPIVEAAIKRKTNKSAQRVDLTKCNIDLSKYKSKLGEDRAICCLSALAEYKSPIIVVDLGTATTINFIDSNDSFIGGAILIGVQTGLTALFEHTAALPKIEDFSDASIIGDDTRTALISGAVIGNAGVIEGYINRIETSLGGTPTIVVTGGNASMILPHCRFNFIHNPTLLIDGLFTLYNANFK